MQGMPWMLWNIVMMMLDDWLMIDNWLMIEWWLMIDDWWLMIDDRLMLDDDQTKENLVCGDSNISILFIGANALQRDWILLTELRCVDLALFVSSKQLKAHKTPTKSAGKRKMSPATELPQSDPGSQKQSDTRASSYSSINHLSSIINHQSKSSNIKHQTSNIKHQTSNIKHQTSNIKHQTSNIKHQTSNIKHQTSNIKHLTSKINHHQFIVVAINHHTVEFGIR
jgi:hypothetical protein